MLFVRTLKKIIFNFEKRIRVLGFFVISWCFSFGNCWGGGYVFMCSCVVYGLLECFCFCGGVFLYVEVWAGLGGW